MDWWIWRVFSDPVTYTFVHAYTHTCIRHIAHAHSYTHTPEYTIYHMHAHSYMHTHICTYTHIIAHAHLYTHTHVHAHTHPSWICHCTYTTSRIICTQMYIKLHFFQVGEKLLLQHTGIKISRVGPTSPPLMGTHAQGNGINTYTSKSNIQYHTHGNFYHLVLLMKIITLIVC